MGTMGSFPSGLEQTGREAETRMTGGLYAVHMDKITCLHICNEFMFLALNFVTEKKQLVCKQ